MKSMNTFLTSLLFEPSLRAKGVKDINQILDSHAPFETAAVIPVSQPPYGEGLYMRSHLDRTSTLIAAFAEGASWHEVEQLSQKSFLPTLVLMSEHLHENALVYRALILALAFSKIGPIELFAPEGSKGAAEGFLRHGYREKLAASDTELRHYANLAQSFRLPGGEIDMEAFFKAYQITAHYPDQSKRLHSPEYAGEMKILAKTAGVEPKDLLSIVRHFEEVRSLLSQSDSLALSVARSAHPDMLLWANLLLIETGKTAGVVNLLTIEMTDDPSVLKAREDLLGARKAKELKEILKRSNLLKEDVFELCGATFGPERGELMQLIRTTVEAAVLEGSIIIPVKLVPIEDRIQTACRLLTAASEDEKMAT